MTKLLILLEVVSPWISRVSIEPYLKKKSEIRAEREEKAKGLVLEEDIRLNNIGGNEMTRTYRVLNNKIPVNVIGILLVLILSIYGGYNMSGIDFSTEESNTTIIKEEKKVVEEDSISETPRLDSLSAEDYQKVTEHFEETGIDKAAQKEAEEIQEELEEVYEEEIKEKSMKLFLEE